MLIIITSGLVKSAGTDNDIRYRSVGGNSGYMGYSMSKRAAEAREEGRFPKTDFKKEYDMPQQTLDALVAAGVIDNSKWHHTSKYGILIYTPFCSLSSSNSVCRNDCKVL